VGWRILRHSAARSSAHGTGPARAGGHASGIPQDRPSPAGGITPSPPLPCTAYTRIDEREEQDVAEVTPAQVATDPASGRLIDGRQSLGPAILDDLFPDEKGFRKSIITYTVLLALAGLIAAFGLYQDSTASIIGAMVVAPLGGAIMALAAALVSGRMRWQGITLAQVGLGALLVIAIGYAVSWLIPDPLTLTPALRARTSPGVLDLGVALAAGAAGAFVTARRTGTDALPGVAIAVSLVPPLATVGICLELGRMSDAAGAMVLFLTNFSAIVVVACIVFLLAGTAPSREQLHERRRLRVGFALAVVLMVLAAIPLFAKSAQSVNEIVRANQGAPYVEAWLQGTDLEITDWQIRDTTATLDLRGSDPLPDTQTLASELATAFGAPADLVVNYTPTTRVAASATP
jgi:uncharacterized hydrophobic protein (TIGR00271 family)